MPQNEISTWLNFALQQMAAESYLHKVSSGELLLSEVLDLGNNNLGKSQVGFPALAGATRMTSQLIQQFTQTYDIVSHHANDSTGFSATLIQERGTNNFTLSFRSTEYRNQSQGGDFERDGANGLFLTGADGEILTKGFAFGQLAAMEDYYQSTVKNLLPPGAVLNVTGYSLGAHLATVFTELHGFETSTPFSFGHTYTFDGPGRGTFNVALQTESQEAQRMREMVNKLTQVLLDPDAGLPTPRPPDDQLPTGYILAKNAQQADQLAGRTFDPFAAGNTASVYSDARYLWAKEVVSVQFGPLSSAAGDIPRTDGAFSLITQIVGHASQGDTEYVANSGNHAAETRVFIEDQPNLDNFGGFFGASGDFGTTHSITLIVDSLALQELFQTIAPALQQTEIESMLWASSNELATGTTIGTSGTAEAKSLEHALDALRKLFLPGPVTETAADPATGGFDNLANRNTFYTNIAAVKTALAGATVTIEPLVELNAQGTAVIRLAPSEVNAAALENTDRGLAYRYALKALNPFAVIGADYTGLGHASNGQLALFDPTTGFGEMTDRYLTDRAAFLEAKMELGLLNNRKSDGRIYFKDLETNYEILTTALFQIDNQYYLFGGAAPDTLQGEGWADELFGGGGNDTLLGQGGTDYLEGNQGNDMLSGGGGDNDQLLGGAGFDTYVYNTGDGSDTVIDRDDQGRLLVNGQLISGGIRRAGDAASTFHSTDNAFTFLQNGTTLTING